MEGEAGEAEEAEEAEDGLWAGDRGPPREAALPEHGWGPGGLAASVSHVHERAAAAVRAAQSISPGIAVTWGTPPPPSKWTRRVPHSVLIGHAASLTPY